jgi:hypothetical protein
MSNRIGQQAVVACGEAEPDGGAGRFRQRRHPGGKDGVASFYWRPSASPASPLLDLDCDDGGVALMFGLGRAHSTIQFPRGFGSLNRVDPSAGPRFGHVLIAGGRPEPSLGRGVAG